MFSDPMSAILSIVVGISSVHLLISIQAVKEWGNRMSKIYRSSIALEIEISLIAEALYNTGWQKASVGALYERRPMPRSVYDGLGCSGILSELDTKTQELLYRFYWMVSLERHDDINSMIEEVAATVAQVKRSYAPGWIPRTRLTFRLTSARSRTAVKKSSGASHQADNAGADPRPGGSGALGPDASARMPGGSERSSMSQDSPSAGAPIRRPP